MVARDDLHAFVVGGSFDGIRRMQLPKKDILSKPYGLGLIIEWE